MFCEIQHKFGAPVSLSLGVLTFQVRKHYNKQIPLKIVITFCFSVFKKLVLQLKTR